MSLARTKSPKRRDEVLVKKNRFKQLKERRSFYDLPSITLPRRSAYARPISGAPLDVVDDPQGLKWKRWLERNACRYTLCVEVGVIKASQCWNGFRPTAA